MDFAVPQCVICFQPFKNGDEINEFPCTHSFHGVCIGTWLEGYGQRCPLCNVEIHPEQGKKSTVQGVEEENRPVHVDDQENLKVSSQHQKAADEKLGQIHASFKRCPMCEVEFPNQVISLARVLSCGHYFHEGCMQIITNNGRATDMACPSSLCTKDPAFQMSDVEMDVVYIGVQENAVEEAEDSDGYDTPDSDEAFGSYMDWAEEL